MKTRVKIVQPYYSYDYKDADTCFTKFTEHIDSIAEDADLIVLLEYSDVPTDVPDKAAFDESIRKYHDSIMKKAVDTAKRCQALVFVNAAFPTSGGYRNTTYAIDRTGTMVGTYFKAHPAPSEVRTEKQGGYGMDVDYSYEYAEPYVLEIDGVRYGFMTCYDFYFYEAFAALARKKVDIIIGTSHQRTDTHQALEYRGQGDSTESQKVQLYKPYFNQEMVDLAHANGIHCNVFWSDDPEETKRYLDMGIDTILTNDYLKIANLVKGRRGG